MKRLITLLVLLAVLVSSVACGTEQEEDMYGPPGDLVPLDTTPTPTDPAVTSSNDNVPPLTNRVELVNGEGTVLEVYSELIWVMDGSMVGDGMLMFQSVPNRLPAIAEKIPSVVLSGVPTVRIITSDTETAHGGDAVSVYGEDYSELAHRISWEEVLSRGQTEWAGRTLYLHFSVNYNSTYTPEYTKCMSTAYFAKTTFPQP